MSQQVAFIYDKKDENLTINIGAKPYVINKEHCNFNEVLQKLRDRDYTDLQNLLDIPLAISNASNGKIIIQNETVYYNGKEIHNVVVDRIMDFMREGFPFEPLALFLENLLQNPLQSSIDELYLFLESGKLPITEDGCFLAYKKVNEKFESYHASPDGTHLAHPIGGVVSMPRDQVDSCRSNTCSSGLHFCSLNYLSNYEGGSGKVLILKINPRDVVAIPSDYKNAKGRASCYTIMAEYDAKDCEKRDAFNESLVDTSDGERSVREAMVHVREENWGVKSSGQRFNNLRDSSGRFKKRHH